MKLTDTQAAALKLMAEHGSISIHWTATKGSWMVLNAMYTPNASLPKANTLVALAKRDLVTALETNQQRVLWTTTYRINDAGRAYLAELDAKEQQP